MIQMQTPWNLNLISSSPKKSKSYGELKTNEGSKNIIFNE